MIQKQKGAHSTSMDIVGFIFTVLGSATGYYVGSLLFKGMPKPEEDPLADLKKYPYSELSATEFEDYLDDHIKMQVSQERRELDTQLHDLGKALGYHMEHQEEKIVWKKMSK